MSDFKESLTPLTWAYRLIGLATFEIPKNIPRPKLTAIYVITLGLSYSCVLWSKWNMSVEQIEQMPLVNMVFLIVLIFNVVAAVVSVTLCWISRKDRAEFVKRIRLVDETLQSFGIDPKYKREQKDNRNVIILFLIAIAVLFVSGIVIYGNICDTYGEAIIQTLSFFCPQVWNIFIELTFTITLTILQKRFEKINALLSNAVRNSSQTGSYQNIEKYLSILKDNQHYDDITASYYAKNRNNLEYLLPTTRQLHLDLCVLSEIANRVVGLQIAMQMSVKFALLIGYSYTLYLLYKEENMEFAIKLNFCIYVVIRIIYGITRFYVTIKTSENISEEAQRTCQIVQEIDDKRQNILDEIHQYSLQILHNPLHFTANGFYGLDFNFVRSFANAVAFYLIILIQNQPSISETADAMISDPDPTTVSNLTPYLPYDFLFSDDKNTSVS